MRNNFYTLLPSNSSHIIHPDNNASNYTVELPNPIYFDGEWEVALTEFNFIYTIPPYYSGAEIKYERFNVITREIFVIIDNKNKKASIEYDGFSPGLEETKVRIDEKTIYFFNNSKVCQESMLTFDTLENAQKFKLNNKVTEFSGQLFSIELPSFKNNVSVEKIRVTFTIINLSNHSFRFENDLYIKDIDELNEYVNKNCKDIFSKFTLTANQLLYFELDTNTRSVTFDPILVKSFGLGRSQYIRADIKSPIEIYKGIKNSKIIKSYDQMFIYCSIVDPIIVGDVTVPLLKAVWIEEEENDKVVQIIIDHPMYLPISATRINNIEINIRDDSGKFIEFPKNTKTHLTLHFRKINNES